jgi:hypothetical protein
VLSLVAVLAIEGAEQGRDRLRQPPAGAARLGGERDVGEEAEPEPSLAPRRRLINSHNVGYINRNLSRRSNDDVESDSIAPADRLPGRYLTVS